ncbi:MAG: NVEALA domain-containing protein [Tannerellaceae bacterium]|jgi:hypothetical protein|nr:NVEALA domain-containing protein [Tannerellaceae bacterium]
MNKKFLLCCAVAITTIAAMSWSVRSSKSKVTLSDVVSENVEAFENNEECPNGCYTTC